MKLGAQVIDIGGVRKGLSGVKQIVEVEGILVVPIEVSTIYL
jgi:hypothetical protein